jgi:hypothetical protein
VAQARLHARERAGQVADLVATPVDGDRGVQSVALELARGVAQAVEAAQQRGREPQPEQQGDRQAGGGGLDERPPHDRHGRGDVLQPPHEHDRVQFPSRPDPHRLGVDQLFVRERVNAAAGAQRAARLGVEGGHVEIEPDGRVDGRQPAVEHRHLRARAAAQQAHGARQFARVGPSRRAVDGHLRELRARARHGAEHGRFAVSAQPVLERGEQQQRRHPERHDARQQQRREHPRAQAEHAPAHALRRRRRVAHGSWKR